MSFGRAAGRSAIAIFGGYAAMNAFVGLFGALLPKIGMAQSEALVLAAMLAFPLYTALIVWVFGVRDWGRASVILFTATAAALALAATIN